MSTENDNMNEIISTIRLYHTSYSMYSKEKYKNILLNLLNNTKIKIYTLKDVEYLLDKFKDLNNISSYSTINSNYLSSISSLDNNRTDKSTRYNNTFLKDDKYPSIYRSKSYYTDIKLKNNKIKYEKNGNKIQSEIIIEEKKEDDEGSLLKKKIFFDKLRKNNLNNYLNLNSEETKYYYSLLSDKRLNYWKKVKEIFKDSDKSKPLRFKIIDSMIPNFYKSKILQKLEEFNNGPITSEYPKYISWCNSLLKIPFGKYINLPITIDNDKKEIADYLHDCKNKLNEAVYGHNESKDEIVQYIAQLISNPKSVSNVIGLWGKPGTGKTSLVKFGIAKAIDRPFYFVSLGGLTDSSFFLGHSFTYEGSIYGKIADILMSTKCMNPVIYFDELDKLGGTTKGEELTNVLIHLTDAAQNDSFHDNYFSGVDLDLSKALFIFSFNDITKVKSD